MAAISESVGRGLAVIWWRSDCLPLWFRRIRQRAV